MHNIIYTLLVQVGLLSVAVVANGPKCVCKPGFNSSGLLKAGGVWEFDNCEPAQCTCANGTEVASSELSAFLCELKQSNCASCNPGFFLSDFKCTPYGGNCLNGKLIAQHNRTQHNHCGSCDKNFEFGNECDEKRGPAVMPKCEAGFGINATYQCEACAPGRYQKQLNATRYCIEQTQRTCKAGEELRHENDTKRDTVCENCAVGKFSNAQTSFRCTNHTDHAQTNQ